MQSNALARKIAFYRQHFSCPPPHSSAYHEPGTILDEELRAALEQHFGEEVRVPLYFKPADIIDAEGKLLRKRRDVDIQSKETTGSTRTSNSDEPTGSTCTSNIDEPTTRTSNSDETTTLTSDEAPTRTSIQSSSNEKIKNYLKKRFAQRAALARQQASLAASLDSSWRARNRRREADWGDPEDLGVPAVGGIAGHVGGKTWRDALCEWIPEQESVRVKTLMPSLYLRQCGRENGFVGKETTTTTTTTTAQWSDQEKKTFIELFLQFPKNFARLSASLPLKSTEQCVQFYYLNKQRYRLKQMVVSYRRAMAGQRRLTLQGEVIGSGSGVSVESGSEKRRVGRPKVRKE